MSAGIIGGADGPTTIFIASPNNPAFIAVGAFILLGIIVVSILIKKKMPVSETAD